MKKEMLINVLQPEECRIAILEDGVLEELYVERTSQESYVGNIYKGRIVNIEPSIQAAFVDFGIGRNGFLHVSDVEPAYYRHLEPWRQEEGRRNGRGKGRGGDRRRGRPADPSLSSRYPDVELPDEDEEFMAGFSDADALSAAPDAEPEPPDVDQEQQDRAPGGPTESGPGAGSRDSGEARTAGEQEHGSDSPTDDLPPDARDSREPPRYMGSAERRTEEDDEPAEDRSSEPSHDDADIFFPRPDPSHPEAPQRPVAGTTASSLRGTDDAGSFPPEEEPEPPVERAEDERAYDYETDRYDEAEGIEPARSTDDFESEDRRTPSPGRGRRRNESGSPDARRRRPPRDDRRRPRGRNFGRPGAGRPKPLIQDIFRRGQEVLVQVIKEGIGTKGPTLSTYISIAGRYLVLMPGLNRVGVSRKIADDNQRRRLREIFHELQPPRGLGFIIRTAGIDKTKKELQRDLAYLSRLWQVVVRRIRKLKAPSEIYQESDMITRTIRDTFTNDIDTIWVDEPAAFEHAQEFLQIVMPRYASRIKHYTDSEPLFYKHGIEEEIARIQQRHVPLAHGGSIVIDQTEALVAIDVNSGNFRADNNAEETAYQMNLQAAREIARQLRLRDLGGVIVNDFIDMRDEKHRRDVERALRDAVKRDRARTKILKISAFGLIEMTRQRIRPSLKRSVYQDCPACHGSSQVKTCESMSIDVMRLIQLAAHRQNVYRIQVRVHEEVANYLLNRKRTEISRLEESGELQVTITPALSVSPEFLEFLCFDNNNNEVKFLPYGDEARSRRR
jgi:ribonuclease E